MLVQWSQGISKLIDISTAGVRISRDFEIAKFELHGFHCAAIEPTLSTSVAVLVVVIVLILGTTITTSARSCQLPNIFICAVCS
jgi:hypothetical protein